MSQTELKMQPTIHLEGKAGHLPRPNPVLRSKCIVGCVFNSLELIITRESSCILHEKGSNKEFFLYIVIILYIT
jgi:hypothetical protein